jgi:endonuclease/exonuclease/phosphatase family metal-dependent hydrolase
MDPLRVMSFNIRYDTAGDGTDNWSHRRRLVADTIRYHAPDVIGIQEAMAHQLRELAALLDAYEWVGRPRDGDRGEHTAIGYRNDRVTAETTETFWLSPTPETPGSVGWDASHPRIATWARLQVGSSDQRLLVLNTHLDRDGQRARREGSKRMLQQLTEQVTDEAVVVGGDFNCRAGGPAYERASGYELPDDRTLRDSRAVAARRHGPTTTRTDFHTLRPDRRIDHLFVSSDMEVERWSALTDRDDDHYPSDHLPILSECRLG